jgi:ABC-2 type transport system permease protein
VIAALVLLSRRNAPWILTWSGSVLALVVATLPAYASTYSDAAARHAAVEQAQRDGATRLLYGRLPDPGTAAQMFVWEVGAFVTLLVAVVAVLTAVRLTRAAEQDGTLELLRTAGLGAGSALGSALTMLTGFGLLLGGAATIGVGLRAGRIDGVDWSGAWAFGAVVALTFLLTGVLTVTVSQLVSSAWAARVAGACLLAAFFALRATADAQGPSWLNRLTPLGLRATVGPFTVDAWPAIAVTGVVCLLLAAAANAFNQARELGGSLVRLPATRARRLRVTSPFGLAWRLDRASCWWWTVGIALGSGLLTALGSGVVESARQGRLSGGFLGSQLSGDDPVAAYLRYSATIVGILVAASAILSVLRGPGYEREGPGAYMRTLGCSAARVAASHVWVALVAAVFSLALAGLLTAIVAPHVIGGDGVAVEAVGQIAAQAWAVLVLVGTTVLVAGWIPRLAWVAWTPYVLSVGLVMLGPLLGVPQGLLELGAFDPHHGIMGDIVRFAVFLTTGGLGLLLAGRRDVATA